MGQWIDDGHELEAFLEPQYVRIRVLCPYRFVEAGSDNLCGGGKNGQCWVEFNVNEVRDEVFDDPDEKSPEWSARFDGPIPIVWRIDGSGEDSEMWVKPR